MIWIHRLLAQLGEADFYRLATLPLARRIGLRLEEATTKEDDPCTCVRGGRLLQSPW